MGCPAAGRLHRIDAKSEEAIKFLVCGAEAERVTCDQIPVECFEWPM